MRHFTVSYTLLTPHPQLSVEDSTLRAAVMRSLRLASVRHLAGREEQPSSERTISASLEDTEAGWRW